MKKLEINEKNANLIRTLLYILAGIAVFIFLITRFTFGFVPLFILLLLFLLFPIVDRSKILIVYSCMIILFGGLAMYALNNYINPDKEVFSNNDHHALRLDGIIINEPVRNHFILAGDSEKAFFDDDSFKGLLSIADITDSSVILKSKGFTRPVYKKRLQTSFLRRSEGYYTDRKTNLVSSSDGLPMFYAGDEVELLSKSRDENGRKRRISFVIEEFDSGKRDLSDSCNYVFKIDGQEKISSRHTFLRNSLPLSDLAADVVLDFDPAGISVIRDYTNTSLSRAKLLDKKADDGGEYADKMYSFDIDSRSDVSEIRVNGRTRLLDRVDTELEIPLDVPFYIGSGSDRTIPAVFRKRHQGDTLCLEYELPRYRYLSSFENQVENTLMITTTLFDTSSPDNLELAPAFTDNILLFDVFDRQNNRNQLSPSYISFVSGNSSEVLDYDFITEDTRHGDQRSLDYVCAQKKIDFSNLDNVDDSLAFCSKAKLVHKVSTIGNPDVSWMISVENFKQTTPFTSRQISFLLLFVIMTCAFMIQYKSASIMEYVAYLILIAFLTVRLFLMWRTTVFPPVTAVSFYEFSLFRNSISLGLLITAFVVFILGIYATKRLVSNKKAFISLDFPRIRKFLTSERWRMYAAIFAAYTLGVLLSYILPFERITNIMLPVAIAVVLEILIHWLYARTYILDIKKKDPRNPIGERRNPVLMSMLNLGIASVVTFVKDGGYGVMFILFSMLFLVYKFLDLRTYTPQNRNTSKATICKYLLFIFAIAFILLYKDIFIFLFNHRLAFFIIAFFVILILAGLISVVLDLRVDVIKKKGWIGVAVVAICCIVGFFLAEAKMDGTHMEYRIRVHMDTPENTLAHHIKSQTAQTKFMQASINDWILDEYSEIGKEVRAFGEDGLGYFKMQPQSKLGAQWFAQTTDIVLSRFIIAEHSQLLAILFIFAFVVMLAMSLKTRSERRWTKMVMVMVPLLLATQAMLIWLANTGRFIFFGQDFPLISITSKLSVIYFFFLLLMMVIASLVEMPHLGKKNDPVWNVVDERNGIVAFQIVAVFAFIMIAFLFKDTLFLIEALLVWGVVILLWNFYSRKKKGLHKRKDEEEDEDDNGIMSTLRSTIAYVGLFVLLAFGLFHINQINKDPERMHGVYDVGELMRSTNADIENINYYLKAYQKDHPMTLESDMYSQMDGFMKYLQEQNTPYSDLNGDASFTALILQEFMKNDCRNNTVLNLLHVRNERSYNSKGVAADTLVLALKSDYFRLTLPKRRSIGWKGSIVEYQEPSLAKKHEIVRTGNKLQLSGQYVYGGQDILLVSADNGKNIRIMGSDAYIDIASRSLPVGRVNSTDVLMVNGKRADIPIDKVNYFARNVMINGQRTFLYPRGSELFWIRDFATQIQNAKNSTPKSKRDKRKFHDNVEITLDGELVTSIYSIYLANSVNQGGDRTVVVANGDGLIKAMVDFRKREDYRLNPNDSKTITSVMEELQLNGEMGKSKERLYFENMAISPLRLGPGSSQKPLTWTAVSTGYNTGWWESLAVDAIDNRYLYTKADAESFADRDKRAIENGRYLFRHFAGHRIQSSFNSIPNDEGAGTDPVTLDYFIRRSSNYYNGVLAYLGAFPVEGYYENNSWLRVSKEYDEKTLFRERPAYKDAFQYDSLFPIMRLNKDKNKEVVFNAFLKPELALDTTALLPSGLSRNLGLRPNLGKGTAISMKSLYPSVSKYRKSNNRWEEVPVVLPGRSYFNLAARRGHYSDRELNENLVRSVAIGNNTSWQVSPLQMAEMYGRMITMNRGYHLTLDPDDDIRYDRFEIDESWHGPEKYQKSRTDLLLGLSQNFQRGDKVASAGQAKDARPDSVYIDVQVKKPNGHTEKKKYYIYGKTGTIDGIFAGLKLQDHLLAAVITDRKLSECDADALENVKFYVIYFADYGDFYEDSNGRTVTRNPSWSEVDKAILNAVMKSRDFRNYMNTPENSSFDL